MTRRKKKGQKNNNCGGCGDDGGCGSRSGGGGSDYIYTLFIARQRSFGGVATVLISGREKGTSSLTRIKKAGCRKIIITRVDERSQSPAATPHFPNPSSSILLVGNVYSAHQRIDCSGRLSTVCAVSMYIRTTSPVENLSVKKSIALFSVVLLCIYVL